MNQSASENDSSEEETKISRAALFHFRLQLIRKLFLQICQTVYKLHKNARVCIRNIRFSKIIVGESEDSKDIPYFYDLSQAYSLDEEMATDNLNEDGINVPESSSKTYGDNNKIILDGEKVDVF